MLTLTVLFFIAAVSAVPRWNQLDDYTFEQYCHDFQKSYPVKEAKLRKQIFESRLKEHKIHNSNPTKTSKLGVNQFTDMRDSEISMLRGGLKAPLHHKRFGRPIFEHIPKTPTKATPVDWRTKGIITPVKDQGRCGSCWSFASAETVESYYTLKTGLQAILSEQQILDCTQNPLQCGGTGGCGGATAELAFQQIIRQGGLSSEWTYSYNSYYGDNGICNLTRITPVAVISNYINLPMNQAAPIIRHLQNVGPLAVSVDASTWPHYESGVWDGCNQTNPDLDHAVQLVGMGTDPRYGDYWLIRNSWSPSWGENGYIRLRMTPTARCGVDITPLDGDGCVNGSHTEIVCGTCGVLYDALYTRIA